MKFAWGYDSLNPLIRWYYERRQKMIIRTIRKQSGLTLDVGCGGGHLLERLRQLSISCVGVDVKLGIVKDAKQRSGALLVVADAVNLPLRNETFDFCAIISVLEHLKNPLISLKECYRVLKQDGLLICSVPIERRERVGRFLCLRFAEQPYDEHQLSFADEESIRKLINESGFDIFDVFVNPSKLFPINYTFFAKKRLPVV